MKKRRFCPYCGRVLASCTCARQRRRRVNTQGRAVFLPGDYVIFGVAALVMAIVLLGLFAGGL